MSKNGGRRIERLDEWGEVIELGQSGAVWTAQGYLPLDRERGQAVNEAVCQALTDCNAGKPLDTWEDWLRVGQRIGIRQIEFHDPEVVPAPMLRYDGGDRRATAVLYLPYTRSRRRLYLWLLHEFSECAMARDLTTPFHYPADWGDHHDMAQVVELHHQDPIADLNSLPDL